MYEVELKLPAELDPVRERLADHGATALGTVRQRDTYYDHPSRSFERTDEALRIRTEERDGQASTAVTYKGPLLERESKTRRELETEIGDGEEFAAVLGALDFEPVATVEKERERYEHAGFVVTLDRVTELGTFVEVEDTAGEDEIERRREAAKQVVRDLGLDPADHRRTSYLGMLLDRRDN